MQRRIDHDIQLGKTVSPFGSIGGSSSVDRIASKFTTATEKVNKIKRLINTGEYDADLAKYIPRMLNLIFQGIIEDIDTKEQVAHILYKNMENPEFQTILTNNYYTNPTSIYISFPMKIKRATNEANDINTDLIPVNIFFCHLVKQSTVTTNNLYQHFHLLKFISILTWC